jgi:hypothetical protein
LLQVKSQLPLTQARLELAGPCGQGVQLVPQESGLVFDRHEPPHWW